MLFIRRVFNNIALFWTSSFLAQDALFLTQAQLTVSHQVTKLYEANFGLNSRLEYNADYEKLFSSQFIQLSHFSSLHLGNTGKYRKIPEKLGKPGFWIFQWHFEAREASQRLPRACGIHPV